MGRQVEVCGDGREEEALGPREIGEKGLAGAWAWYAERIADAEAAAARGAGPITVSELFEAYLEALAGWVDHGEAAVDTYRMTRSALTTACSFKVGGVKFGAILVASATERDLESVLAQWSRRPSPVKPGKALSAADLSTAVARIKTAFRWAVRPGDGIAPMLPKDPLAGSRGPRSTLAEVEILSRSQAAAWLRWLRGDRGPDPITAICCSSAA